MEKLNLVNTTTKVSVKNTRKRRAWPWEREKLQKYSLIYKYLIIYENKNPVLNLNLKSYIFEII